MKPLTALYWYYLAGEFIVAGTIAHDAFCILIGISLAINIRLRQATPPDNLPRCPYCKSRHFYVTFTKQKFGFSRRELKFARITVSHCHCQNCNEDWSYTSINVYN